MTVYRMLYRSILKDSLDEIYKTKYHHFQKLALMEEAKAMPFGDVWKFLKTARR